MNNALRTLAACLIGGLAATVGVAWGLAAWFPQEGWRRYAHPPVVFGDQGWSRQIVEFRALGAVRRAWETEDYVPGISLCSLMDAISRSTIDSRTRAVEKDASWGMAHQHLGQSSDIDIDGAEHATGWPLLVGWYRITWDRTLQLEVEGGIPVAGIPQHALLADVPSIRALPLYPIWRGVLLNTLFYATFWFLTITAIRTSRRTLRRRAGRCPTCAYDQTAVPIGEPCPECGLRRTARASTDPMLR